MSCPVPTKPVSLASELYAVSQHSSCEGGEICHYCGAPCKKLWMHDETPPTVLGGKVHWTKAKHPNLPWICVGCWLWRRKRQTVAFLDGTYKDCQSPSKHSWWITSEGAWSLNEQGNLLYEYLLAPPLVFSLALITKGAENHLQYAVLALNTEILAETPLPFTLNSTPHFYTVYELTEAIITGEIEGKSPGIAALFSVLGPPPEALVEREKAVREEWRKKQEWEEKRGRPEPLEDGRVTKRKIR